jgi:hypothetical protein
LADVFEFLLDLVLDGNGTDEGFPDGVDYFFLFGPKQPPGLDGDPVRTEHAYKRNFVACGDVEVRGLLHEDFVTQCRFAGKSRLRRRWFQLLWADLGTMC